MDDQFLPLEPADESGDPADLGEPIAELVELGWMPSDRFGQKVTGGIERRLLTGRFLDLAWTAPLMVLLEFLRLPIEALSENRRALSDNRRE